MLEITKNVERGIFLQNNLQEGPFQATPRNEKS